MTTENQIKQSIFPDYPREIPAIDKNGNFTSLWDLGLGALFQALQRNFKNEGIILPPLSAANMITIQNLYSSYIGGTYNALTQALPDISGQTVFDTDTTITNQFVILKDSSTPPNVLTAKWVPMAFLLTNNGNPNGSPPGTPAVAGNLNWLCYDSSGMHLWICTTAGGTGTIPLSSPLPAAVWTQI